MHTKYVYAYTTSLKHKFVSYILLVAGNIFGKDDYFKID